MIKWFERHLFTSWSITVLLALTIFYISSQSFPKGTIGPNWAIKPFLYHLFIFFIFSLFLSISLAKGKPNNKIFILIAVLIALAYGISDELHQLFVPGRACTISDVLIDAVGVTFAGVIYATTFKKN